MALAKKNCLRSKSGPPKMVGTGPGLPKHPRVEPRAGPDLDLTHPY